MFNLYAMVDYNFQAIFNLLTAIFLAGFFLWNCYLTLGQAKYGMRRTPAGLRLQDGSSKEPSFKITERDSKSTHDLQRAMEA